MLKFRLSAWRVSSFRIAFIVFSFFLHGFISSLSTAHFVFKRGVLPPRRDEMTQTSHHSIPPILFKQKKNRRTIFTSSLLALAIKRFKKGPLLGEISKDLTKRSILFKRWPTDPAVLGLNPTGVGNHFNCSPIPLHTVFNFLYRPDMTMLKMT